MCGEHLVLLVDHAHDAGSSPHVRGTQTCIHSHGGFVGIIPACAGNTPFFRYSLMPYRDHPRMCGEHWLDQKHGERFGGSSPHVRGTLLGTGLPSQIDGIIPACAGNT